MISQIRQLKWRDSKNDMQNKINNEQEEDVRTLENQKICIQLEVNKFTTIDNAGNLLDNKAGVIASFSTAIILFAISEIWPDLRDGHKINEFVFSLILLIITIFSSIYIIWPRAYRLGSVDTKKINQELEKEHEKYLSDTLRNIAKSNDTNLDLVNKKALGFKICITCFFLGIIFLSLAIMPTIKI